MDTANGQQLAHRADERFAMCSTFKWVLAASVLAHVDRGALALDEQVPYGPADLLEYAPAAKASLDRGFMTIEALAVAAVTISDNTAANLLLAKTGGPPGLTEFMRSCGDTVTRLDRLEPDLNDNIEGDPRDTTTPRARSAEGLTPGQLGVERRKAKRAVEGRVRGWIIFRSNRFTPSP